MRFAKVLTATLTGLFLAGLCMPVVMAAEEAVKAGIDRTSLPIKAPEVMGSESGARVG